MTHWWRDLSVSKKLYGVVGVMAFLIATELGTLYFAMTTLSAVRAFVGGEGLWSKAEKTAVYNLQLYASTHDPRYYQAFLEQLRIPLGDRRARLEVEKPEVDVDKVSEGFIEGDNNPADLSPMIHLLRRFHSVPHLARAVDTWRQGDLEISRLMEMASQLDSEIKAKLAPSAIDARMAEISKIDQHLSMIENEFSFRLGEASRWLENVLMGLLALAVLTIEGTGLAMTVSFARGLTKVLGELNTAAVRVGEGDFSESVPVRSRDELGQLAKSLNKMTTKLRGQISERQDAEHASETKNLFLANMSHEIRTPLNAILGFSELLADPNLSDEDRLRYAAIVKRTGSSLTTIINDILDISRIEAEQVEVESSTILLPQMMSDLYTLLRMRCEEKGIDLNFVKLGEVSELIQTDPTRLRQILANIIGNAIKFTDQGSVTVTYRVVGPHLLFEVEDTGGGIPIENVDRLFRPFSQGDDSIRKKYGGTGLGLMISQRLAQLLGGDVYLADNRPGVGSTFGVKLKYEPAEGTKLPKNTIAIEQTSTSLLKGRRILMVEDARDNQLLAQLYLTRAGAQVEFANNGKIGVEMAKSGRYDVILMDIQMPVMDGYTATRELRDAGETVPIVALTGFAMKEDQEKCLHAGCTGYVTKPFDRAKLVEAVYFYASSSQRRNTVNPPGPALTL